MSVKISSKLSDFNTSFIFDPNFKRGKKKRKAFSNFKKQLKNKYKVENFGLRLGFDK
jgi:hypothetical protein